MLAGVEGFRPLGLGWDGGSLSFPPPQWSPPRSLGSPFTRHLALDLVGAAPGAPGRDPGGAAAAITTAVTTVTTAVTAVLRSRPDGAVHE